MTKDVDLTLLTGFGNEETYIYENLQPLAELKEAPELIANLRTLEKKWRGR